MSARAVALCLVEEIDGDVVTKDDHRVWMVQRALSACRWRGLTVGGVARQAAMALDAWHASCRRLQIELAWLLDSSGPPTHLRERFEARMLSEMRRPPTYLADGGRLLLATVASKRAISRENPLDYAWGGSGY